MMAKIESVRELEAYKMAFEAAMRIFHVTKAFPAEERFSLTDQIRRASRSVCANLSRSQISRKVAKNAKSVRFTFASLRLCVSQNRDLLILRSPRLVEAFSRVNVLK